MAFHARLGAESLLGRLEPSVLVACVMPYATRRSNIMWTRCARVRALSVEEGLGEYDDGGNRQLYYQMAVMGGDTLLREYLFRGARFSPARFRRRQFVARSVSYRMLVERWRAWAAMDEEDEDEEDHAEKDVGFLLERQLPRMGLRFDVPLTPAYAERAEAMVRLFVRMFIAQREGGEAGVRAAAMELGLSEVQVGRLMARARVIAAAE
jgi:hypothetical protein